MSDFIEQLLTPVSYSGVAAIAMIVEKTVLVDCEKRNSKQFFRKNNAKLNEVVYYFNFTTSIQLNDSDRAWSNARNNNNNARCRYAGGPSASE